MRIRIELKEPRVWGDKDQFQSNYLFIETSTRINPGDIVSVSDLSIEREAGNERLDVVEEYTSGKLFKAVSAAPTRNHNGTVDLIEV